MEQVVKRIQRLPIDLDGLMLVYENELLPHTVRAIASAAIAYCDSANDMFSENFFAGIGYLDDSIAVVLSLQLISYVKEIEAMDLADKFSDFEADLDVMRTKFGWVADKIKEMLREHIDKAQYETEGLAEVKRKVADYKNAFSFDAEAFEVESLSLVG